MGGLPDALGASGDPREPAGLRRTPGFESAPTCSGTSESRQRSVRLSSDAGGTVRGLSQWLSQPVALGDGSCVAGVQALRPSCWVTPSNPPRWTQKLHFLFGAPATSLFTAHLLSPAVCLPTPQPPRPCPSQFSFVELCCLPGNPLSSYRDWGCYFLRPSPWATLVRPGPAMFARTWRSLTWRWEQAPQGPPSLWELGSHQRGGVGPSSRA